MHLRTRIHPCQHARGQHARLHPETALLHTHTHFHTLTPPLVPPCFHHVQAASIHPCQHANVMHKLSDRLAGEGGEFQVER